MTHDGPLDCSICDKPFRSQRLLGTHQRSHVRLDCPFCKRIITSANYETHVKMNHVIPTKGESSKTQPKRPVTDSAQMAAKRARFGTVQVSHFRLFFEKICAKVANNMAYCAANFVIDAGANIN